MLLSPSHAGADRKYIDTGDENSRDREASSFFFRWRFEISAVETPDNDADEAVVVSCECRGVVVATEPFSVEAIGDAQSLQPVLAFEAMLYSGTHVPNERRNQHFDGSVRDQKAKDPSTVELFESFIVRLAIRDGDPTGELIDCMALDLSTLVREGGCWAHHTLDLQMDCVIHCRVKCVELVDSESRAANSEKDSYKHQETSPIERQEYQVDRFNSGASAESLSDGHVANYLRTFRTMSLEDDDTQDGNGNGDTWAKEEGMPTPNRLSMISVADESNATANEEEANSDHDRSFSEESAHEIERTRSSVDFRSESRAPHSGDSFNIASDAETYSSHVSGNEDTSSIHNRVVLSNHPFAPLVASRFSHDEYRICANGAPWYECPITTSVQSPKPLCIWSIQGPELDDEDDSDDDMEDLGDGVEVPKRNIEKLRAAWRYIDSPGKCGLPAAAGKLSALQVTKCWYARKQSPSYIVLERQSTAFNTRTTVVRAVAMSSEKGIEVSEPLLSDSESDSSSIFDGESDMNVGGAEEFVCDWETDRPGSVQSEFASTHYEELDECEALDSGCNRSEHFNKEADPAFCQRMIKLEQRISTLNEERLIRLQQARAVSEESDVLEAECQHLRSKLKFAGDDGKSKLSDEYVNDTGMNHLLLRTVRLKLAGDIKLRRLTKQLQHEQADVLAKSAECDKLTKEKGGTSVERFQHERDRLQRVVDSLHEEISSHHGIKEHLSELSEAKFDLALIRAENQKRQLEISKIRNTKESSKSSWNVFAR